MSYAVFRFSGSLGLVTCTAGSLSSLPQSSGLGGTRVTSPLSCWVLKSSTWHELGLFPRAPPRPSAFMKRSCRTGLFSLSPSSVTFPRGPQMRKVRVAHGGRACCVQSARPARRGRLSALLLWGGEEQALRKDAFHSSVSLKSIGKSSSWDGRGYQYPLATLALRILRSLK